MAGSERPGVADSNSDMTASAFADGARLAFLAICALNQTLTLSLENPRRRSCHANSSLSGLQATKKRWWERVTEGDGLIFYVTRPVGGAIGLGKVSTKFKQDKPLWPREVEAQRVLWPLRFEFDVDFCFRPEDWRTCKLEIDALRAIVQAGFQPLKPKTADVALQAFAPFLQRAPDVTG